MNITNNYRRLYTHSRRGMILLVVMAVLSLFAVMGMTFILMTGKNRDSAEATLIATQSGKTAGNSPQELLEEGIMQVLVGPGADSTSGKPSTNSALYGCDLLGDMYNIDPSTATTPTTFTASFSNNKMQPASQSYAGKVVTIVSGQYKGQSTLVLNASGAILPFASGIGSTTAVSNVKCIVNSKRAFQDGSSTYDVASLDNSENCFMSLRYGGGIDGCTIPVGRVVLPSYYRGENVRPGNVAQDDLGGTDVYNTLNSDSIKTQTSKETSPWDIDNDGDGDNDSVWMNLGLPPRPMADGTLVVPMYAILVEDMDGRINVNAHGMKEQLNATSSYSALGGTGTVSLAKGSAIDTNGLKGQGYGPAEINIQAVLGNSVASTVISNRGLNTGRDLFQYRFPEFIDNKSTVFSPNSTSHFYRTPLDFYGMMAGAIDQNGMFIWEKRGTVGNMGSSTYELDLGYSQPRGKRITALNSLYSPEELEAVLRIYDDDSLKQEDRLVNTLTAVSNFDEVRNQVTTESWDLPMCNSDGWESDTNIPEEIRSGFKMDINRPLTSYEDDTTAAESERTQLAKDLYYLLLKVYPGCSTDRAAQWAVNAVDFRDGDSVCTHLEVNGKHYFGCERPELLIAETFAYHARMTEDGNVGGWRMKGSGKTDADNSTNEYIEGEWYNPADCTDTSSEGIQRFCSKYGLQYDSKKQSQIKTLMDNISKMGGDGVADLDQVYLPECGLYIAVFNPWTNVGTSDAMSTDIYQNNGVNLMKVGSGSSPVWRIAINSTNQKQSTANGTTQNMAADVSGKVERAVYFGNSGPSGSATYSFVAGSSSSSGRGGRGGRGSTSSAVIKPGSFAVIGPSDECIISRTNVKGMGGSDNKEGTAGTKTRSIVLTSSDITIDGNKVSVTGITVNKSNNIKFSLTDIGGYTAGVDGNKKLTSPLDKPYDSDNQTRWENIDGNNNGLGKDCIIPAYRTAFLQRLANPYKAYNATTNPYVTIDTCPIDLNIFNGRQTRFKDFKQLNSGNVPKTSDEIGATPNSIYPKSRHRGETQYFKGVTRNIWLAEAVDSKNISSDCSNKLTGTTSTAGNSAMKNKFAQSFGKFDTAIFTTKQVSVNGTNVTIPQYENIPAFYFPNRPFNSIMELLLVPQVSAYELTSSAMVIDRPRNATLTSGNNSLPNCIYPGTGNNGIDFINSNASKLFNYVRIQSPYSDTPMCIDTFNANGSRVSTKLATKGYRWSFREPGKININSINSAPVWAALLGNSTNTTTVTGMQADLFKNNWGKVFESGNAGTRTKIFGNTDTNFIATNSSLFQLNGTTNECQSASQSPYFQTQLMQRLSNMTTTRSNVFAVWITVGFFELKSVSGTDFHVGKEYGLDNGSRQRYRAFYLIDRTRPAGYSPGKRYNAEKTILLRRYLP